MRYFWFILAFGLGGCAPPGYVYDPGSFVAHPVDFCSRADVRTMLIGGLRKTEGMAGADFQDISTTYIAGFSATDRDFSCHGTLVTADRARIPGTVSVSRDPAGSLRSAWESDDAKVRTEDDARRVSLLPDREKHPAAEETPPDRDMVPIEKKAVLFDASQDSLSFIQSLSSIVRSKDYRCDSISAARPMILSRGFVLVCNNFHYAYDIRDKGGRWQVEVE